MTPEQLREYDNLNALFGRIFSAFKPPEGLTAKEWAEKYRRLPEGLTAEAGLWRCSRTPYFEEPLNSFTDPNIHDITVMTGSQMGKSEFELNVLGYLIDQDPGPVLYIQPTDRDAEKYAVTRIDPMILNCDRLTAKVLDVKGHRNTISHKTFPGGSLTLVSAGSVSGLASTPIRVVLGDEVDRWKSSAGREGDPWGLAKARTITFYNRKRIRVSSPTIKGDSAIEEAYLEGTQEAWCHQCPDCGHWAPLTFADLKIDYTSEEVGKRKIYKVDDVRWACPECAVLVPEPVIRKQPARWIAGNPEALKRGHRSFWVRGLDSPWQRWQDLAIEYLSARDDPEKYQVFMNTKIGELWEDRGDVDEPDTLLARRETYFAEVPDGVRVLTCGVDVQNDRLEYEVVGYGRNYESWGIRTGVLWGDPEDDAVWQELDERVLEHDYTYADGRAVHLSATCVDSGYQTTAVYLQCMRRIYKRVRAIKGLWGDGVYVDKGKYQNFVNPKTGRPAKCWLHIVHVDVGKQRIMDALKVQEPGPKYCHFPLNEDRGYGPQYFEGLLSERPTKVKSHGRTKIVWTKLTSGGRNEALDCRGYAQAALTLIGVDLNDPVVTADRPGENPKPRPASEPASRRRAFDDYSESATDYDW